MRTSNFSRNHPYAKARGWVGPNRAAPGLPRVSDGVNEVDGASEILVVGGTVSEPEDGVAQISFGGLSQSSNSGGGTGPGSGGVFAGSAGTPVFLRNNSSVDLLPGDVVVTDPSDDSAVTTTSTASNTRIAGVVQAPIARLAYGPVLFNGLTTVINTTGTITRGAYALTSATATKAAATASRVGGSFGVYLTGTDLPDFASAARSTASDTPTLEMDVAMPNVIPAGRVLFLAVWVETGVTPTVSGWTRIGAETGFWYYRKVSDGDDTATVVMDTASVAVATVLVLHPSVSQVSTIAAHDYDSSTSAATVSGLSDLPRYAIAGVKADVTPGSGFARFGGGTAGFASSGTPALVQSATPGDPNSLSFGSAVTQGNVMISVPFGGNLNDQWTVDPRQGGACPVDVNMTQFARGISTETSPGQEDGNNVLSIFGKVFGDTYAGPFGTRAGCLANVTGHVMMEFENIGIADYEVLTDESSSTSGTIDLGTFSGVGANDLVIMAVIWKATDGNNGFNPGIGLNGFTEVFGNLALNGTTSFAWVGYKVGDGDASITASNAYGSQHWAAAAVKLTQGTSSVGGTLAGKYIGHASSATSPFSGAAAQNDAIFVLDLIAEPKPSALLYGPDLGASEHVIETITETVNETIVETVQTAGFVGEILVADTPAGSPLVFDDLLQNEAGTDLLYADTGV